MSKLFWLDCPDPEPTKLLITPPEVGLANAARILPACGEIRPIGIRLPVKAVRPDPSTLLPVAGSNTWPPWLMEGLPRYLLKSQKPVVFVAGLHVVCTSAVGIVT